MSELAEDKRVATDILLSIEAKLETIDKRHKNSENLLKLIPCKAKQVANFNKLSSACLSSYTSHLSARCY